MYKYNYIGAGSNDAPPQTQQPSGSSKALFRNFFHDYIHYILGSAYVAGLITITILWNSPSLIILSGAHLVLVSLFMVMSPKDSGTADRIFKFIFPSQSQDDRHPLKILSWHIHNPNHNWLNLLHLLVLIVNLVFFLNFVQSDMPPSSIKFPEQTTRDHGAFGSTGFTSSSSITDYSKLSMVELASKGYYQLEEYKGYIGMNNALCGSTTNDWKCFAVGVRTPMNDGTSSTWYQPLPSDAYDVDLQVAVGLQSVTTSPLCPPVFMQHVTGQGNVMGPYRSIMDFDWTSPSSSTLTPTGTLNLGSITQQRQTFSNYLTSFRAQCSTSRVKHDDGGVKYSANYIPIPLSNNGPIDMPSGGIKYTIVIMMNATYAPFIRVTPKKTPLGMPLEALFMPVSTWFYDFYTGAGVYGTYAPIPELATVPFPGDYAERDYSKIVPLYGFIFIILICIAWYYFVTIAHGYEKKALIYTAFFVRVPLLILGIYSRTLVYAASQGTLAMFLVSYHAKSADTTRRNPFAYFMWFITFALTITHVSLWSKMVLPNAKLLNFNPFLREMRSSSTYFPMGDMESSPMIPFLVSFLLLEPCCTLFMYVLVFGKFGLDMLKKS